MTPFIVTIKSFNSLRQACFTSQEADPDFEEIIAKFTKDFMNLKEDFDITVLVKAHEVFWHVAEWIKKYPDVPLGKISEQPDETLHSAFKRFVTMRNMIQNTDNPKYLQSLFDTVVAWNSKRIK